MAIGLILNPPPAFDKSIVPAFQTNFNRIRDAFLSASMQTSFKNGYEAGPWSKTINILVPYRCDIMLTTEITNYAVAVGFGGTIMYWDGNPLPIHADMYWNQTGVHASCFCVNEIRRVEAGTHSLTQLYSAAILTSDTNDRLRWSALMIQVT